MTVAPINSEDTCRHWHKLLQEAKKIADRIDRGEEKMVPHEELKRLMLEKIRSGAGSSRKWQT